MFVAQQAASEDRIVDPTYQRERMNGYLKPLRRKVGVMTLVLACLFAGGWVRSRDVADAFVSPIANYRLESLDGVLLIAVFHEKSDSGWSWPEWETRRLFLKNGILSDGSRFGFKWGWRGFNTGNSQDLLIFVPYWSIVIPLTLISAWLLLSNRRAKKIQPIELATKTEP